MDNKKSPACVASQAGNQKNNFTAPILPQNSRFVTAKEIAEELGRSMSYAYTLIRELNRELKENGFWVPRGRVLRAYYLERTGTKNVEI